MGGGNELYGIIGMFVAMIYVYKFTNNIGIAMLASLLGFYLGLKLSEKIKHEDEQEEKRLYNLKKEDEEVEKRQAVARQDRLREEQKQEEMQKIERLKLENEQAALKERKLFDDKIRALFEHIAGCLEKSSVNPENFITEYYKIFKFCSTIGALTPLYLALPKKHQTFLQLYRLGLNSYDKSTSDNMNFLMTVTQLYGFCEDVVTCKIAEVTDYFNPAWSDKNYFLAYLIDKKQYIKKMQEFQKEKILTTDLSRKQAEITAKYTALMKISNSKSEIGKLLKAKENEQSRLCLQSDFDKIAEPTVCKSRECVPKKTFSLSIPKLTNQGKILNLSGLSADSKIVEDYIVAKKEIEGRLEKQLNQLNDANEIMRAKDSAQKEIAKIVVKNDIVYSLYNSKENKEALDSIGNLLAKDYDQQLFTAILYYTAQSKDKKWLKYIHKISFNPTKSTYIKNEIIISIMNKPSSWNLRFLIANIKSDIAKYVLCSQLIDLYYNASDFDVTSLIELKNDIPQNYNLTAEQKSALLPLVEEIIEKAGRKSKSPTLATEVNVKSKEIEIIDN